MRGVLVCLAATLDADLSGSPLLSPDVAVHDAADVQDAERIARTTPLDMVVLHRDLQGAERLVRSLRAQPATRRVSIVVVAAGEFEAVEVELMAAGANAVLRLPLTEESSERMSRLLRVPRRREADVPVYLEFAAHEGPGVETALARCLNLSANGALIESDRALRIGDDLDLRFTVPGAPGPVVGCGRVVRRAGPGRYGIEFYGLEGEGAELVRRFVERDGLD